MPVALPLIEIGVAAILWLCIALALLIVTIMGKLGDLLGAVPVVGKYLKSAVHSMAQAITGALGEAEAGIDAAIGASWHQLARLWDETWNWLKESAAGYAALAALVARLVYTHTGLRTVTHWIEARLHGIEHGVRDLVRAWRGIEHRVGRLEREVTTGIGHDLRVGLRDVEKELHGIEHGTIPAIEHGLDVAEGKIAALGRFLGVRPGVSFSDWAKGVALAGLAALGLKGLACDNNPLKGKDCGWNGWGNLESLLLGAAAFGVTLDLGDIVRAAVAVEQEATTAVEALVNIDSSVIHEAAVVVAAAANAVAT